MKKFRISLLWQVLIAIVAGIVLGQFLPAPVARLFVTFNGLFGNFLNFIIPLIIIGLIFTGRSSEMFLNLGILAFSLAVLFQIVTLPVEFNASNRAIRILASSGIMYEDELRGAKKVLGAAALTYVAGAASSILQLLRIILIAGNRRR